MKIQMITLYAGPAGVMPAGSVQDLDPALAGPLIAGGYARSLEQPRPVQPAPPAPIVETAALEIPEPEKAVLPRPARRRKS